MASSWMKNQLVWTQKKELQKKARGLNNQNVS
jgi:hypothetical protein